MGSEVVDLQRIATITCAFSEAILAPTRLVHTIAEQLADVLGDACSVMLVADDGTSLVPVAHHASRAWTESGEPALAEQMLVPLRARGKVIGQLVLDRHRAYDDADRELATIVADYAALAIDHERMAVALREARSALQVTNRELEVFSYSIAHDLRAPLRSMTGFARLLLEDYGDKVDGEGRDWLVEIQTNAAKMTGLIDALLSLARLARAELRTDVVDLSALVRDAIATRAAAEPGREVEVDIADRIEAEVDVALARVLVANLVGNAWKFTGQKPRARISFGEERSAHGRTFFVRDSGAGFDPRYADKLFAPFQRLHPVVEFPGTGVGLAAVQRIVHRHGGRVWANGEVGVGATFYFTLAPVEVP